MSVAVSVRGVGKRFDPAVQALDAVSLDVAAGSFVSIVGPSGCGKSTLLRIIAGLIAPTSGSVWLDGAPVTRPAIGTGFVFQNPVLLDWRTLLDNVLFNVEIAGKPANACRQRARELLALTGLADFENHYPYQLSGGMQQRAALCRALLAEPSLILMDEPFGALDVLTRERLGFELQRILAMTGRCTVIFVTHSIAEAVLLSDTVLVMSERPGHIRGQVAIDLPRPRNAETTATPEFVRLVSAIRALITPDRHEHPRCAAPSRSRLS